MIIGNVLNMAFVIIFTLTIKSTMYSYTSETSMVILNIFLLLKFWFFNFVLWMYTSIGVSLTNLEIVDQKNDLDYKDNQLDSQKKIMAIISHECRNQWNCCC